MNASLSAALASIAAQQGSITALLASVVALQSGATVLNDSVGALHTFVDHVGYDTTTTTAYQSYDPGTVRPHETVHHHENLNTRFSLCGLFWSTFAATFRDIADGTGNTYDVIIASTSSSVNVASAISPSSVGANFGLGQIAALHLEHSGTFASFNATSDPVCRFAGDFTTTVHIINGPMYYCDQLGLPRLANDQGSYQFSGAAILLYCESLAITICAPDAGIPEFCT